MRERLREPLRADELCVVDCKLMEGFTLEEISKSLGFDKRVTLSLYLRRAGFDVDAVRKRRRLRVFQRFTEMVNNTDKTIKEILNVLKSPKTVEMIKYLKDRGGAHTRYVPRLTKYEHTKLFDLLQSGKTLNSLYKRFGFSHRSGLIAYIRAYKKREEFENLVRDSHVQRHNFERVIKFENVA